MALFAFLGDIHGRFAEAAVWTARAVKAAGPLDAVIAVGDVQANRDDADVDATHQPRRHRELGDFPRVLAGEITFPTPVHFIGGNHEPWAPLDALGSGEWAPGWTFLGRAGVTQIAAQQVAFLSGIAPPEDPVPERTKLTKHGETYFSAEDLSTVRAAARRQRIDLLVTHDWPADLLPMFRGHYVGSDAMRRLVEDVSPALHVAGHVHLAHRDEVGASCFVALDRVGWDHPGCVAVFDMSEGAAREVAIS